MSVCVYRCVHGRLCWLWWVLVCDCVCASVGQECVCVDRCVRGRLCWLWWVLVCDSVCVSVGQQRVCGQMCVWTSVLAVVGACV